MGKIKKYWDYYLFFAGEFVTLIILMIMLELDMFENQTNAIIILFLVTLFLAAIRIVRFCVQKKK